MKIPNFVRDATAVVLSNNVYILDGLIVVSNAIEAVSEWSVEKLTALGDAIDACVAYIAMRLGLEVLLVGEDLETVFQREESTK